MRFECDACGGRLVEQNRFWLCENCGTKFALSQDDEGKPFTYHPLSKKELNFGQIAERAAEIHVNEIAVKEIKLKDTIEADVYRESNNLEHQENVRLIMMFLENEEWDAAQDQINQLLLADYLDAEAGWYSMACSRRTRSDKELVRSFSTFTDADAIKLDSIIQNATPAFATRILDLIFKFGYSGDEATAKILALALPYIHIDSLYSEKDRNTKIESAFDRVISCGYCDAFEYLLYHTLQPDEVERYICYLERFAQNSKPAIAQKYYELIIAVDPGNIDAYHNLIKADINANSLAEKCVTDFEGLILYAPNPDTEVNKYISVLNSQQKTTTNNSEFMWSLLGYHSNAPEGLKSELLRYIRILINSELWVEARRYLNLVLSFDARCADAYYGLCLVIMQAKNRAELVSQKENLIDCRELRKAIALYQSAGDEESAKALMELTQEQKQKKRTKRQNLRRFIIAIGIIVTLLVGVLGFNYRRYSENNIKLTVTDKGYPSNGLSAGCHFILDVNVENGSSLAISRIEGVIRYYNRDGELLYTSNVWLTGDLESGNDYDCEIEIELDATPDTEELHKTPLAELKITWELTKVTYENGKIKEYSSGREHVIHKIQSSQNGQSSQEKEDAEAQGKLDAALKVFENGEDNANGYSVEMGNAIETIVAVLNNDYAGGSFGKLFEKVYAIAQSYEEQCYYGKASWLYACLGGFHYEETAAMSDRCYDKWVLKGALESIAEEKDTDPQLRDNITVALATITELYYTSDFAEPIKEVVYGEAITLKQKGQYNKAYYLFEELSYAGYQDAALQMEDCKRFMDD